MIRWCDNRWKTKRKESKDKSEKKRKKIANRDRENDRRRRMNIRGRGEEIRDSLLVLRVSERPSLWRLWERSHSHVQSALFLFLRASFFPPSPFSPPLSSPTHPFLPLVISVFSRACILPSSYTYVRRLSDRSSSRFSSSRIYGFRDGGIRFTRRPDLDVRCANRIN